MKSRIGWSLIAILLLATGSWLILLGLRQGFREPRTPREADQSVSAQINHSDEVPAAEPSAGSADELDELREFQLTDQQGREFDSNSLQNKIWVGSIFFADCPSVCRMQNQRVSELHREFAEQGVEFVSITCDPANDTPKRLADYSKLFNADPQTWHFLTGELKLIERIGNEMLKIAVAEEVHSDRLVIFDRSGKIVGSYRSSDRDEFLKATLKLKELLASGPTS